MLTLSHLSGHIQVSCYIRTGPMIGHHRLTCLVQISFSSNDSFTTELHLLHYNHLGRTPDESPLLLSDP